MQHVDLTIEQVAQIAGCHRNTILNFEKRGYIRPMRDSNNFRRYTLQDALKLKVLVNHRRQNDGE